jgi:hypothetical protein
MRAVLIRRELILPITLYFIALAFWLLYGFPGPWRDSPASWRAELSYAASKQLEANHLLVADDLALPQAIPGAWGWFLPDRDTLVGKYVKARISQKQEIAAANLREQPGPVDDKSLGLVVFPLDKQAQLCNILDAGSYVDVMGPKDVVALRVRVHAIGPPSLVQTDKPSGSCFALLEVAEEKEPLLAPDQLANMHLTIHF